ncbi:hypothetical protein D6764_00435 [Candidatus Woesearchaeota archaeon]|nr:MAG: hypothetical protein D6764_00435 [Candidatus Woesearchaeota archaeon]
MQVYFSDSDSFPKATYAVSPGKTLGEVLSERYAVDESFSLIKCLDDICNEGRNLWHVTANGKVLSRAPLEYELGQGDVVAVSYGRLS